nr:uncharacterized protein LOC126527727 isoform X1 [Dermacentor andersoni]
MKPAPEFRITNLVDEWQYKAWLTFTDSTGRQCVGQYCHPDSPRPGSWFNGRVLSFSKVKLFSYKKKIPNPPPITLRCYRTYHIQVNVGIVDDNGYIVSASVVRQSVGADFIAVTSSITRWVLCFAFWLFLLQTSVFQCPLLSQSLFFLQLMKPRSEYYCNLNSFLLFFSGVQSTAVQDRRAD